MTLDEKIKKAQSIIDPLIKFVYLNKVLFRYAYVKKENSNKTIIIVHGKNESLEVYYELALDFYQKGYSVFLFDQRNFGMTKSYNREDDSNFLCHITSYDKMADDLLNLMEIYINNNDEIFVFAHSLGCAVTLTLINKIKTRIKKVVMSAPFFDSSFRPIKFFMKFCYFIQNFYKKPTDLFWFQKEASYRPNERYTNSIERFNKMEEIKKFKKLKHQGGVSLSWIKQSLLYTQKVENNYDLTVPTFICIAEKENVVSNKTIFNFIKKLKITQNKEKSSYYAIFKDSHHEIYKEIDKIRNLYLQEIIYFLQKE